MSQMPEWMKDAEGKGLPKEFVERLESSDAVTEAEKAKIVSSVSSAADLEAKRKAAIAYGKLLGEDEAKRRNEPPDWAESRVKRAMMYAAWEFDGKPVGRGGEYRKEFGIPEPAMSDPRVNLGSDFVQKRER